MTPNPQSRLASIETPFARQDEPLTFVESGLRMMQMRITARAAEPRAKPGLPP